MFDLKPTQPAHQVKRVTIVFCRDGIMWVGEGTKMTYQNILYGSIIYTLLTIYIIKNVD